MRKVEPTKNVENLDAIELVHPIGGSGYVLVPPESGFHHQDVVSNFPDSDIALLYEQFEDTKNVFVVIDLTLQTIMDIPELAADESIMGCIQTGYPNLMARLNMISEWFNTGKLHLAGIDFNNFCKSLFEISTNGYDIITLDKALRTSVFTQVRDLEGIYAQSIGETQFIYRLPDNLLHGAQEIGQIDHFRELGQAKLFGALFENLYAATRLYADTFLVENQDGTPSLRLSTDPRPILEGKLSPDEAQIGSEKLKSEIGKILFHFQRDVFRNFLGLMSITYDSIPKISIFRGDGKEDDIRAAVKKYLLEIKQEYTEGKNN